MGTISDSYADSPPATVVRTFGQLWQIPTFLLGLAILGGAWVARPYWYDPESLHFGRNLAEARRAVDSGASVQEATQLLNDALGHADRHPQRQGEIYFLLGSAYVRLAETANSEKSKELWQNALHYLELAQSLGTLESDKALLVFRTSRARFHTDPSQETLKLIVADMNASLDKLPDERWETLGILTQAYLKFNPPDVKAALSTSERQLQLPLEDEKLLDPVRLLRGELLLRAGEREEARKTLARISPQAPATLLQHAHWLLAQSFQEDQLWSAAAEIWEQILADARTPATDKGHALYCLGVCYQNLNKPDKAEGIWANPGALGGEEQLAAKLFLAELRLQAGRFDDAAKIYEQALGDIEKPADYRGQLVPVTKIAATLEASCQAAEKAGSLDSACRLAKLYSRVARHESGALMVARMAEAKANASGALKDFKEAGMAYEAAALALGAGPQESRLLWSSAKNLLAAKDYPYAESVIEHYIALKPPADGLSEAYYRLGEIAQAQQALERTTKEPQDPPQTDADKPSKAEENWRKCYEGPGAFAGRAGVKLAIALQQRNKLSEAEEILKKNLDSAHLDEAQEESMFLLANIIFLRSSYTRAAQVWEQALTLYPSSRSTFWALYQLGECYRRLADRDIETERQNVAALDQKMQDSAIRNHRHFLGAAEAKFIKLTEDIQAKRASGARLTEFENDLLRQGLFALADCRFEHGQYEEARQIYLRLGADYQERIEGVEALRGLFQSYVVINPPDLAKAAEALNRQELLMKALPDAAFDGRPDRDESRRTLEKAFEDQKKQLERLNELYGNTKKDSSGIDRPEREVPAKEKNAPD